MQRSNVPVTTIFLGVALVWAFATAIAGDDAGWEPLVAPVSTAIVIAAFGWLRRGHDVVDVFAQGIGVSYAAFIGLALARVTEPNMIAADWWLEPLNAHWPVVLLAGIAYALILTVFVAIPIALIPVRHHLDIDRNARFLSFLDELARRDDFAKPRKGGVK
jgi:hypothetical protein